MPRLLVSAAHHLLQEQAALWLQHVAPTSQVLVLAETARAALDFVRASTPPNGGFFGVHPRTLGRLAVELACSHLATKGLSETTALAEQALAVRSAHELSERNQPLTYLAPIKDTPRFGWALSETLSEYRMERLPAEDVRVMGPAGRDLHRLLTQYANQMERAKLADRRAVFDAAIETAGQGDHPALRCPILILALTPQSRTERRLVKALLERTPDALVTVLHAQTTELDFFSRALRSQPELLVEDVETATSPALARARRNLFSWSQQDFRPAADDRFVAFSALGQDAECLEIARRAQGLALGGQRFDEMAVLLRSPEPYQAFLETAFRRADIPVYLTRGTRRPHPAGRALLLLLRCAREQLSASRFAEYLSLAEVPALSDSGAPLLKPVPWVPPKGESQLVFTSWLPKEPSDPPRTVDDAAPVLEGTLQVPERWETLLTDAAVIGGLARWKRRLNGLAKEFQLQIQHLTQTDPLRASRRQRDLRSLQNLKQFALPIIERLDAFRTPRLWGDWLEALFELASLSLKEPEEVLRTLGELRPMASVGPVALGEVHDVLTERLGALRTEEEGPRYGRLFVGTAAEAAGRVFETVFLPGLHEGAFPKKSAEDPLLLDVHRQASSDLPTKRPAWQARERRFLRQALGAARSRLVFSYPRWDLTLGKAAIPSFYALELMRAGFGEVPTLQPNTNHRTTAHDDKGQGSPENPCSTMAKNVVEATPMRPEPYAAVDETEYDLAVIHRSAARSPDAADGFGRYLIEDATGTAPNPILARALRTQALRFRSPWSSADGLADAKETAAQILRKRSLLQVAYSPTALQHFAQCPYRFFLYGVHRLRPRDEIAPLEDVDPLTRGSLFHEIQFELFGALKKAGLLPVNQRNLPDALSHLGQVFSRVVTAYEEELAPAIPQIWRQAVDVIKNDLRSGLTLASERDTDWRPLYAELAFGLKAETGRDPESSEVVATILDGYLVRGAVDLVEENLKMNRLRITDYKTGRVPYKRPLHVGGGEFLQPLLYALAVEAITGRPVDSGRLFYATQRGSFSLVDVPVTETSKHKLAQVLSTIEDALQNAFLPAAPREGGCRYCDYKMVCGSGEEHRVRRKETASLCSLEHLRRLP